MKFKILKDTKETGVVKNAFRIFGLVWKFDKKSVLLIYLFLLTSTVFDVWMIWLISDFVNVLTSENIKSVFDIKILKDIALYTAIPIVATICNSFFRFNFQKLSMFFQQNITDVLLIDKKNELDIQVLENSKFSSLMERVNSNSGKLFFIWEDIMLATNALLGLIISAGVIFFYKWWFILLLLIAVLPDLYLEIKYGKTKWGIWNLDAETRKKYQDMKFTFNQLPKLLDIRIFGNENFFKSNVRNLIYKFNSTVTNLEWSRTVKRNFGRIFLYCMTGIMVFFIVRDTIDGIVLVGTFAFYLNRLSNFRNNLINFFTEIGKMSSDNPFVNDIFEFLDTKKVIKNGKIKLGDGTPRVEFKNVSFAYPNDTKDEEGLTLLKNKYILEDLNLVIEPGEKIAIVGVNGAGKTTFTKTLMRFYDVTNGEILIDGKNIKEIDINTFYEKLGYLPQDYARYTLTIAEAISISDPYRTSPSLKGRAGEGIEREEIIEASKKAGSHEFIMGLEKSYDTQLGKEFEGGVEPSVGQWQKLALARLFYKNPQVWILDEPTASIDAVAEIEIFNELEKLPKDKTVILISHRFNTVKNADKIIVIEHGKIAEMGSHEELMSIENGHYKNLFNSQKDSYL